MRRWGSRLDRWSELLLGQEIEDYVEVSRSRPEANVAIVSADHDSVTMKSLGPDLNRYRRLGLEWPGGVGHVGSVTGGQDELVTRELRHLSGVPPVAGQLGRLGGNPYPCDPSQALGISFADVTYSTDLGEMPAWLVVGSTDIWAILVHGRRGSSREAVRWLPLLMERGWSAMAIGYRNDPDAPRDPSGLYRFGETEWVDLEAACRYAVDHGAERLVLLGFSMGGSIVASFLTRSSLAGRVRGVVLDSPELDLWSTLRARLGRHRVPVLRVPVPSAGLELVGKIASLRLGLSWRQIDYIAGSELWQAPILVFHGEEDTMVPVSHSVRLERARPDLVTLRTVGAAEHLRSWNEDPDWYEREVRQFLGSLTR